MIVLSWTKRGPYKRTALYILYVFSFTHPCARPDVGSELEDGHLEHEVDAGDELRGAGQRVDEGPGQVQVVVGPPVPAYPHTWKNE